MIGKTSTRQIYEACGNPVKFTRMVYHGLGLCNQAGQRYRDEFGRPMVRPPKEGLQLKATEFSLRDLAESIIGEDWARQMSPDTVTRVALQEQERPLLEAGTNAVTATAFANINAFTAVVTGLLEISVMDGWDNPEFIMEQIMPSEKTRMFQGRKVIGTTRLGDVAEPRIPGMPTKRAGFGERWILQPSTVENALSCEVTQEAVFLDLTGEVLEQANDVGYWTHWRKEIRQIDAFIGVTNTYSYKGTTYNTYLTASTWDNYISSGNELVDQTNIEQCLIKFREMQDPETSLRVGITPTRMLVNQEKFFVAQSILGATENEIQVGSGVMPGTGSAAGTTNYAPISRRKFANPFSGKFQLYTSPLIYQRMTDATGLNISATAAGKTWFMWDSKKPPMRYAENWPLRVQQAAPQQLDMIDRGIVLFVKADERGVPMVYEPRRIVQSRA